MKKITEQTGERFLSFIWGLVFTIIAVVLIIGNPFPAAAGKMKDRDATGGILKREIKARQNFVSVRLTGVTQYELTEIFNHILINTPGVVETKQYLLRIEPDNPQACLVVWKVRVVDTDPFQLESNVYRIIRDMADNDTGLQLPDITFQPTAEDLALLRDIRPWRASSNDIQFVLYHTTLPDRGRDSMPYADNGHWRNWPDAGFE